MLLYEGRLLVQHQGVRDAAGSLSRLRVLHTLVLDAASYTETWGVSAAGVDTGMGVDLVDVVTQQEEDQRTSAGMEEALTFLDGLEQLYVHRLIAVPRTFQQYLTAARRLRLVGLQRCEGISLSAVVSTLESRGFRRLEQDGLPNPECRAFASSLSRGGVVERFVVLKRDERYMLLKVPEAGGESSQTASTGS